MGIFDHFPYVRGELLGNVLCGDDRRHRPPVPQAFTDGDDVGQDPVALEAPNVLGLLLLLLLVVPLLLLLLVAPFAIISSSVRLCQPPEATVSLVRYRQATVRTDSLVYLDNFVGRQSIKSNINKPSFHLLQISVGHLDVPALVHDRLGDECRHPPPLG